MFRITIEPQFRKRLQGKDPRRVGAILACIKRMEQDPRYPSLRTRRIAGKTTWEARADGSNRLEWEYGQPDEIILINHCSHDQVYP